MHSLFDLLWIKQVLVAMPCASAPARWARTVLATVIAGTSFCFSCHVLAGPPSAGEMRGDVVFSDYGALASNPELVRRLVSPLTAMHMALDLAGSGKKMATQSVDLAAERFLLYVPRKRPGERYGLLVFVPPWEDARLPQGWGSVLDQFGLIYVSAARSGNTQSVLGRREPLALLAAENIMRQFPVDPERVYIAGFSGGARVALRLVLGYPDLFRGAIVNAGSDPIGSADMPLPPADLFLAFQQAHLVYVTGARDDAHVTDDLMSVRSMHHWCMFNVESFLEPGVGHEVAAASALRRSLDDLAAATQPDPGKLAACRSALDTELHTALQRIDSLIANGRKSRAQKQLQGVDARFGGLAAPATIELASTLLQP